MTCVGSIAMVGHYDGFVIHLAKRDPTAGSTTWDAAWAMRICNGSRGSAKGLERLRGTGAEGGGRSIRAALRWMLARAMRIARSSDWPDGLDKSDAALACILVRTATRGRSCCAQSAQDGVMAHSPPGSGSRNEPSEAAHSSTCSVRLSVLEVGRSRGHSGGEGGHSSRRVEDGTSKVPNSNMTTVKVLQDIRFTKRWIQLGTS
jgi:hypothetical protein